MVPIPTSCNSTGPFVRMRMADSWHSLLCAAVFARNCLVERVPWHELTCIVATQHTRRVGPRLFGDGTRKIYAETHEGGPKCAYRLAAEVLQSQLSSDHGLSSLLLLRTQVNLVQLLQRIQLIVPRPGLPCPRISIPMPRDTWCSGMPAVHGSGGGRQSASAIARVRHCSQRCERANAHHHGCLTLSPDCLCATSGESAKCLGASNFSNEWCRDLLV